MKRTLELTNRQNGLLGHYTRKPDKVERGPCRPGCKCKICALERLADELLETKPGPGRKPAAEYPALTARQMRDRLRRESPLGAKLDTVSPYPDRSGFHRMAG